MRTGVRSVVLCVLGMLGGGLATAYAQAPVVPCEASPPVTLALRSLPAATGDSQADRAARLAAFRALLQRFPSDFYLHQRYQDTAKSPTAADRDAVIAEYRALADKHPKDVGYRFLAARAQVGVNTKEVLPALEAVASSVPRAHLTLIQIYQAPVFKDAKKAREHLEAFVKTCPDTLAAYQYFDSVEPSDFLTRGVVRLRALLQQRRDPESFGSWPTLWSLEFKARPMSEHEALRQQVAEDLKRLRTIDPGKSESYYSTLQEGYKLTADNEGAKWAVDQARKVAPQTAMWAVRDQWNKDNPYPKATDPPEKRQAYYQALVKASADWVRQLPNESSVWFSRVGALRQLENAAPADVEEAGENLLKVVARNPGQMSFMSTTGGSSFALYVADLYAKKGVRLDRLRDLVEQGLAELKLPRRSGLPSDLYPTSTTDDSSREYSEFYGALTVADVWLTVKDKERARDALNRVQGVALKSKPKADVKDATQASRQRLMYLSRLSEYWSRMANLAQLEGRKVDAMTFYQNALLARADAPQAANQKDEVRDKARALWKEIGGTNEGWLVWSDRKDLFAQPGDAAARSSWTTIEKRLPDFQLTDLNSGKWSLAALKGKITLINVWAST